MNKFFYLLIVVLIFSCQSSDKEAAAMEQLVLGEFDAYKQMPHIPCDSLSENNLGLYTYQDSLFTGVCFTNYPNQEELKLEQRQIFQGKLHGNRVMFSPKGDTLTLNLYNHGRVVRTFRGTTEIVNCDSLELKEDRNNRLVKFHFGEPFTGRCQKYYSGDDSLQLYIKEEYYRGLKDGEAVVYDKDGSVILKELYELGEKIQ